MHLAQLALATSLASLAASIQVNIFYAGDCTKYATSFNPYSNGDCYDYGWDDSNSDSIVDCDRFDTCECTFYTNYGCYGDEQTFSGTGGCASSGGGFKSVSCVAGNPF